MKAKKGWMAALVCVLCIAALGAAGFVRGVQLMDCALDGRRESAKTQTRVTDEMLRSQMTRSHAQTRTQGWLTVIETEEIAMRAPRGKLYAQLYAPLRAEADAPWALVLHGGMGTDHTDVLDVACTLSMEGYRVLAPDLYAHGQSEGHHASLGLVEAQDIRAWVDWILAEDMNAQIVIWAQDEGAAAALLAAGKGLPAAVRAVAADGVYASVRDRAHQLLAEHTDGGAAMLKLDTALLDAAYRLLHGVSAKNGEIAARVSAVDMPLLLLHGTGDEDVPAWHSEDIAAAAGEKAALFFAEGAAHGMARHAQPQAYYDALLGFFRDALGTAGDEALALQIPPAAP
ncbi:MAG: alpha/beta fold hydrolase [Clostridia bacterium]|nr:alpha/beta fold hydrolase [Clostridia bacterium]